MEHILGTHRLLLAFRGRGGRSEPVSSSTPRMHCSADSQWRGYPTTAALAEIWFTSSLFPHVEEEEAWIRSHNMPFYTVYMFTLHIWSVPPQSKRIGSLSPSSLRYIEDIRTGCFKTQLKERWERNNKSEWIFLDTVSGMSLKMQISAAHAEAFYKVSLLSSPPSNAKCSQLFSAPTQCTLNKLVPFHTTWLCIYI